jgi:hypothetical protein
MMKNYRLCFTEILTSEQLSRLPLDDDGFPVGAPPLMDVSIEISEHGVTGMLERIRSAYETGGVAVRQNGV